MAFLKKDVLEEWAVDLNVDLSDLSWPQKQKAVQSALAELGYEVTREGDVRIPRTAAAYIPAEKVPEDMIVQPEPEPEPRPHVVPKPEPTPVEIKPEKQAVQGDDYSDLRAALYEKQMLAPLITPKKYQPVKYDEDLGEQHEVEEVYYDVNESIRNNVSRDVNTSTYRIKDTKRRVIAQSTLPKVNAEVTYTPGTDLVPVVRDEHRKGYVWSNPGYPNVRGLLKASGYYEEFKDYFNAQKNPQNIFYVSGKMLAVSIPTVHHVFRLIEEKARRDKERGF